MNLWTEKLVVIRDASVIIGEEFLKCNSFFKKFLRAAAGRKLEQKKRSNGSGHNRRQQPPSASHHALPTNKSQVFL